MDSAFIAFKNVFLDHSYRLPEGFEPATYGTRHMMLNHWTHCSNIGNFELGSLAQGVLTSPW